MPSELEPRWSGPETVPPSSLCDRVAGLLRDSDAYLLTLRVRGTAHEGWQLSYAVARRAEVEWVHTFTAPDGPGVSGLAREWPAASVLERRAEAVWGVPFHGLPPGPGPLPPGSALRPGGGRRETAHPRRHGTLGGRVEGPGVFRIPLGPVRSWVTESARMVFDVTGEDIHHLELAVDLKYRGIERVAQGVALDVLPRLAETVAGLHAVAHGWAACLAVEEGGEQPAPPRAQYLRAILAELERLCAHTFDFARVCQATGLTTAEAEMWMVHEELRRLLARLTGHRYGRGLIVPGGVARDFPAGAPEDVLAVLRRVEEILLPSLELQEHTGSHRDRLERTARVPRDVARRWGARGPVARASGIGCDARVGAPYGPYGDVTPLPTMRHAGDALARVQVRMEEVQDSLRLVRRLLTGLPGGPVQSPVAPEGDGMARVESPEGEVVYAVQWKDGQVTSLTVTTPSQFHSALLPLSVPGNILTDFPIIEASFGISMAAANL